MARLQPHRRFRRVQISYPLVIAGVVFALLIALAISLYPTHDDAAAFVKDKGGFTSITKVEFKWFSFCHKDYVSYQVTGIRNGHKDSVVACMTEFSYFDYIR